ncbi:hypothetical protein LMG24238_06887 [Paraburkholderia sediminicola]|uniref:Putative tail fiber protein gp53-like C-terminal domain-containing protein n=1 Tax=Paraburkholderia sediminicola TaxID=458836 RepID=A0A6J5CS45_9BURK|nr:hypothetical protein [Paraburkholderia sediminicola]CAB3742470.1 hypothetical protein LMG24238_06887 [Paraburkholderia sediminicola]
MDRLIAPNSVIEAQADTAPTTGTPQYATDGNPATNVPATQWPAYQYNAFQEELIAILTAAAIAPDRTKTNQVVAAIKRLMQNTVVLADTGAVNAYTAVNAVPLVAGGSPTWVDGVVQAVKIAHTNTGPSTYAPDGLTPIPIYGLGLQPLQANELLLNGTAILMHATIASVNSGNPICVLMECAGGAQQIPSASQSLHAAQLGQLGAIPSLTATVASSALTATLNAPLNLFFRSATLASGVPTSLTIASNLSLVVPSGATLGTGNGVAATLALLAINNAGTVQLGIVNMAGTASLDEGALISATAISAAATSANTIYSSSAVANCPFRVIGFITATEATAGTWATAPTQVQGASVSLLGFGSAQGSSGYQKFPSGTIMQWGTYATNGSTGVSVTFPIAFPNAVRAVTVSANVPSSTVNGAYDSVNSLTATGFLVDGWQAGSTSRSGHSGNYIAFGN